MIRRILPCLALLTAFATAAAPVRAAERSLALDLSLGAVYNDNFLEYSDNQLQTFKAGTHPLRFAVESTDDVIFGPGASLTWELDQGGGRRHALRVHWDGDFHATNPLADRNSENVRWTESFAGGRRFSLGYARMNHYYVRQLRDEDLDPLLADARWQRAEFDQDAFSGAWRQPLGKQATLGLAYRYEKRDYVPAFRERSSSANQGEVSVRWDELPRRGALELSLGYRALVADADDGDAIANDDDDVSYHGFLGGVNGRMQFSKQGRVRLGGDAGVDFATRGYDSDRSAAVDPFHVGRNDTLVGFEVGLTADVRAWDARAFFRHETNTADLGTGAAPTSDSGSYDLNQVGVVLSWSHDLWKAGSK